MIPRPTSNAIDDGAARWAARVDRAPLSPEEQLELDNWLAADPRHLGAFAKAQAISVHFERARALGPDFDPARFGGPSDRFLTSRRAMFLGTAAAAAAVIAGVVIYPGFLPQSQERRFATQIGETKPVTLEDGSVITLNTASQVTVTYSRGQRLVTLVGGEVLFDVAKDSRRPFIVQAGSASVRAVGTSFAVALLPQRPTTVVVREGIVELKQAAAPNEGLRISANTRATFGAKITVATLSAEDIDRELIWREGRIAFEGSTLAEAAAAFARYSDTHIVFEDPSIARETITGLFVANDPVGFSKAVAVSLALQIRIREGQVELRR